MSNLSGKGTLRGSLGAGGGSSPQDVYWDDILNKPEFAAVATSGSYNDLTDKPTIPQYTGGNNISIVNNVINATYTAGDNITIENGVISASSGSSINYSITEQDTGIKWIDGRPVYQKTIDYGSDKSINANTWTDTQEPKGDIDLILECSVLNATGTNAGFMGCAININQNIQLISMRATTYRYLTIRYTKSTDVIGGE